MSTHSHGVSVRLWIYLLVLLTVVGLVLVISLPAVATEGGSVVSQQSPYSPPDLPSVDLPGWLEPLEPFARLPLWLQAGVAAATVTGFFFALPVIVRWVWTRFPHSDAKK